MLVNKTYILKGLFEHLGVCWDVRVHLMTWLPTGFKKSPNHFCIQFFEVDCSKEPIRRNESDFLSNDSGRGKFNLSANVTGSKPLRRG